MKTTNALKLGSLLFMLLFFQISVSQNENGIENGNGNGNGNGNPPEANAPEIVVNGSLNFGAFVTGSTGGTVTVDVDGTRLPPTGDIILINKAPNSSSVLFDVYARPNSNIAILSGPATITGTNGGVLELELTFSTNQIINNSGSKDVSTPVYMGGILTVGPNSEDVPGIYTGTVNVTFAYE